MADNDSNAKSTTAPVPIDVVVSYLDELLDIRSFEDDSRNGLQVEGPETVGKVGLAVDACAASFAAAVNAGCDLVVVHHGMFWAKGLPSLTGVNFERTALLIRNGMALYACHLPLDAHPQLGNNARLAQLLELRDVQPYALYHGKNIGMAGDLADAVEASTLADTLASGLGGAIGTACTTRVVGDPKAKIKRLGIVSGAGLEALHETIEHGLDALVTGEGPHHANLEAIDSGLTIIYGGHYETEALGVMSVGQKLEERFGLETQFLDIQH